MVDGYQTSYQRSLSVKSEVKQIIWSQRSVRRMSHILPHVCWPYSHPPPFLSSFSVCACFRLSFSTFTILTPICLSCDHLPSSTCSMSVHTFILPHLCSLYSHTPFLSSYPGSVYFPCLLSVFIILTPSFASSPEILCFSLPWSVFVILTPPLLSLSPGSRCVISAHD